MNTRQTDLLRSRLVEILALKDLPRAGWVRAGVKAPESVAAHSWGVAWLALALCPPELNRGRALAIAILHDLPEVRVGDITPHDKVPPAQKSAAEAQALAGLMDGLPQAAEFQALWHEYEQASTPEGRFIKACDKLDMALQSLRYQNDQGLALGEFVTSALERLPPGLIRALAGG